MEYAEQHEINLSLEVISYLNSNLYYAVDRWSNRYVQNKNPAYIENHETLPPLLWVVPGGDPKCKSPRILVGKVYSLKGAHVFHIREQIQTKGK